MSNIKLQQILEENDVAGKPLDLFDYFTALSACCDTEKSTKEFQREILAISLSEGRAIEDDPLGGRLYYGPNMVLQNEDGSLSEYPDRKTVDVDTIDYWENRSLYCKNEVLKARFSGLVWDFKKNLLGLDADISNIDRYVDAVCKIMQGNLCHHAIYSIGLAAHAIQLCIEVNMPIHISRLKNELYAFTSSCKKDGNIGIWAAPINLSRKYNKIYTKDEITVLIKDAEFRFNRVCRCLVANDTNDASPWLLEDIGKILLPYYNSKGSKDKVQETITLIVAAFESISDSLAKLQLVSIYSNLHSLAYQYGCVDLAKRLSVKVSKHGEGIQEQMIKTQERFTIEQSAIDEVINSIINEDAAVSLAILSNRFVPSKEIAKKHVKELAQQSVLLYKIPHAIFDERGRVKAIVGSIYEDLDGRAVLYMSQSLSIESIFLGATLDAGFLQGIYSEESIIRHLQKSPAIESSNMEILKMAIKYYCERNYIAFIHLAIPQIEAGIRHLLDVCYLPTIRRDKNGGFNYKTLEELLNEGRNAKIIPEELVDYYRVLLTDNRGWNLRNEVCHGISHARALGKNSADRILHALICLGSFYYTE